MITSKQIKNIRYFENSHNIFPTVKIRGGICFLHWNKNFKDKTRIDNGQVIKEIDLTRYDIIVPHIKAHPILEKITKKSKIFLDKIVWSRKPFGLEGNYFDRKKENKDGSGEVLECVCKGRKIKKILKRNVPKNSDKANEYQVAFPEASGGGTGKIYQILPRAEHFFILKKNQISTETYSVANSFDTLKEAENFLNFLQTYFARFFIRD